MQNFALIRTSSYGIAALTILLIILTIKYNLYKKINRIFLISILILINLVLISSVVNETYNITQMVRMLMVIFVVWSTNKYINKIYSLNLLDKFWKYLFFISFITCLYGIYQYFGARYGWPYFLNIFNNNPSYSIRGIYNYFGGWTDLNDRVYAVFSEPSFYATFLAYCFLILFFKPYGRLQTITLSFLILINLFLTYSRSGWATLLYCLVFISMLKLFKRMLLIEKILLLILISSPIINLVVMYKLQQDVFLDFSSYARTFSGIYYLSNSYNSVLNFLFGHGLGSLSLSSYEDQLYVQTVAHNGYIEILYSLGYPVLFFILILLYKAVAKICVYEYRIIVFSVIFTMCTFGAFYNIESIVSLVTVIFTIGKIKSKETLNKTLRIN